MTLEEIKAQVEARSKYAVAHAQEEDGAILVVLVTQTPDGADAVSSFALSRLVFENAVDPQGMLDKRVDDACDGLERYVASFKPPQWDQVAWSD